MRTSETIAAISAALAAAQGEMTPAQKDSTNPHFQSKYADLASAWESARPALSKNGLAVIQDAVTEADKSASVTTRIVHSSGEWIEFGPLAIPGGNSAHGVGSALKYARRYSLEAALSIATEGDDDGNAAVKAQDEERGRAEKKAQKEASDRLTRARQSFGAAVKEAESLLLVRDDGTRIAVPKTAEVSRSLVAELAHIVYDEGAEIAFDEFRAAETELRERIRITKAERGIA